MRKKFKVEIARQVFDGIMKFAVVSPMPLNNACELLGIGKSHKRRNHLMLYFMGREKFDDYDRTAVPNELEQVHIDYINTHMGDDLAEYIKAMDMDIVMDDERTFDKTQLLDAVFSAADTDGEWSHEEGEIPMADGKLLAEELMNAEEVELTDEELQETLADNDAVITLLDSQETLLHDYKTQLEALEDNDENKKERTALKVKITKTKKKME